MTREECQKAEEFLEGPGGRSVTEIGKITEDDCHRYYFSEHGIKVVPHSEDWTGYYRLGYECDMVLVSFSVGKAPGILPIPVATFEDLSRAITGKRHV